MELVTRDDVLKDLEPREERFTLSSGKTIIVRELDNAAAMVEFRDQKDAAFKLLVRCAFDEAGARLFTDEDIPVLQRQSERKTRRLLSVVARVNGMDAREEEKNFEAGPSAG